jgi:type IV pilus assembly protein PilV
MRTRTAMSSQGRGFTLVEALIALLVLSIGMLGIAVLFVESLQAGRDAQLRTFAVSVAADLADRIRANRTPVNAYAGAGIGARAIADLAEWRALAAARLPRGEGEVRFLAGTATTPASYTIRVSWAQTDHAEPVAYELCLEI